MPTKEDDHGELVATQQGEVVESSVPALCDEPLKLMAVYAGRRVVAHLAPGDCVGEAALLAEGGTRSASIQAERLVQVCTFQLLSRLLCCSPLGIPICPHRYCCLLGWLQLQWQKHSRQHLCCSASWAAGQGRQGQWQHSSLAVFLPQNSYRHPSSYALHIHFLPCRLL